MSLDKLTKIDGGGISTTSDYRVGVITATKFVGPIEGSITATDASFSGNVSIAGTLTYEDVTNVDSVGILTARTNIILGDSIKHLGDENTLISFPANDTITAHTSGSERLRITSTGRVAIGTDVPIYRLEVLEDGGLTSTIGSASTIVKFTNKSGTGSNGDLNLTIYDKKISLVGTENWRGTEKRIEYNVDDNANKRMWIGFLNETTNTADNIIRFGEAYDTEWMRIDNGKLGIGTANPQTKLHITQDVDNNTDGFRISRSNSAASYSQYVDTSARFNIGYSNPSTADPAPQITLDQNGLIGIGSAIPSQKLDVAGHIKVDSGPILENSNSGDVLQITSPTGYLEVGSKNTSYVHFTTDRSKFYFGRRIIVDEGIVASYNEDLVLATDISEERIRIKNDDGHVGIGTNNPQSLLSLYSDADGEALLHFDMGSAADRRGWKFKQGSTGTTTQLVLQADANGKTFYIKSANGTETFVAYAASSGSYVRIPELYISDSIVHTGDTDTKIAFGTNEIDFQAAGSSRLKVSQYATYVQAGHPLAFLATGGGASPHIKSGGTNNEDLLLTSGTGNPTRIAIAANGNVGINQSNPSTNLDVSGNIKLTAQLMQSMPSDYWSQGNTFIELNGVGNLTHMGSYETCLTSNGYRDNNTQWKSYGINGNTGASQIRLNPAGYIIFGTEETKSDGSAHYVTERLRIKANGNIGINHTNPLVKLHITDGASAGDGITEILRLNASNNDTNDGNKIQFTRVNGASGSITCQKVSSNNSTDMIFGTRYYNTESESMRLTGFGKVGINSSSPQAYIDIEGDGTLAKFGSTDSSYEALYIKNNVAGYPAITNESSPDTIELRSAGSVQVSLDYNNNDTDKYFRVVANEQGPSGTEVFRVQENGSVGIGTATIATNKKLDVCNGIVSIQGSGSVDSRIEFVRPNTGSMGWVGIPNWNPDGFYIYVPTATSNEAGASYGDGTWNFFSNGVGPRLKILSTGNVQLTQNIRLESAPNSTWGAGLNIGGNGQATSSTHGSMVVTNGNLHLDSRDGSYGVYLNWYGGGNGTYFGNGSSGQRGRIDGSGNLSLSGSYPGSDLRLKENIQNISGALDTIKSLSGKTFTWKTEAGLDDWKHYGFIAQEVQKVVPDLVKAIGCHYFDTDDKLVTDIEATESDEDRKNKGITQSLTVNNEGVTPILVEAMKELIAKVETLEAKVSALEGS